MNYIEDLNIADLTDVLPIYYPELFAPGIVTDSAYTNDRIYTFPVIIAAPSQDRVCLIIDREFYASAGSPSVKTVEDVMALYDFGIEHENKERIWFLDKKANRYFLCPFPLFLNLYLHGNGYSLLDLGYLYAEKDGKIIDLFETDILETCYASLAYMYDKKAIDEVFYFYGHWPIEPEKKEPGLSMALTRLSEVTRLSINDHNDFNRLYKVMFIDDYELYPSKYLLPKFIICDNVNVDRAVITYGSCLKTGN